MHALPFTQYAILIHHHNFVFSSFLSTFKASHTYDFNIIWYSMCDLKLNHTHAMWIEMKWQNTTVCTAWNYRKSDINVDLRMYVFIEAFRLLICSHTCIIIFDFEYNEKLKDKWMSEKGNVMLSTRFSFDSLT